MTKNREIVCSGRGYRWLGSLCMYTNYIYMYILYTNCILGFLDENQIASDGTSTQSGENHVFNRNTYSAKKSPVISGVSFKNCSTCPKTLLVQVISSYLCCSLCSSCSSCCSG